MYKKTVTFENFEGEKVTRDLYFNLTKAEITKLQLSYKGGFDKYVESIIHPLDGEPDPQKIMDVFEMLILKSYGVRTEDGGFIKTKEKAQAFVTTEAYSELFMELLTNEKAQTDFFMGIMPKDIAAQAMAELEKKETTADTVEEVKAVEVIPGPGATPAN